MTGRADPSAPLVLVATGNRGKVREIAAILAGLPARIESLDGHPPVRFPEEGVDYAENAAAKARAVAEQLGVLAVADDSGLEVDALDGAPGPLSARYGGPGLDDAGRVAHLLAALSAVPAERRTARFVCVAALAAPDGAVHVERGVCEGTLLPAPVGGGGFGYDPIFRPTGFDVSAAELPAAEKDRISHRGRAFRALRPWLEQSLRR